MAPTNLAAAIGVAAALVTTSPKGLTLPSPVEQTRQRLAEEREAVEARAEADRAASARFHDLNDPRTMPSFLQTDVRWSGSGYAGATIGSNGCGLTAAAMAASWWSRTEVTPLALRDRYGDSCTVRGLNDMSRFCDRLCSDYGLTRSGRFYGVDEAISRAMSGQTVFASLLGHFGDLWVGYGHIVLIWWDGSQLRVQDPASQANTRPWGAEELSGFGGWKYFYSIWKE